MSIKIFFIFLFVSQSAFPQLICREGVRYSLSNDKAIVVGIDTIYFQNKKKKKCSIPCIVKNEKKDYIVSSIKYVNSCECIKEIRIPNSVTFLSYNAFANNMAESIRLGENISCIANSTFYNCKNLKKIIIPSSVKKIERNAFCGCESLCNVSFRGDSVEIENGAFMNCYNLKSFTSPIKNKIFNLGWLYGCNSLMNIELSECTQYVVASNTPMLTRINVPKNNPYLKEINGVLYNKHGDTLILYSANKPDTTFNIPEGTKVISRYAFSNAVNLFSVYLPETIEKINAFSFLRCKNMLNVFVPNHIDVINLELISGVTNLEEKKIL